MRHNFNTLRKKKYKRLFGQIGMTQRYLKFKTGRNRK